jgi:hypothetical protein
MAGASINAANQPVALKLGTLAPSGSSFHKKAWDRVPADAREAMLEIAAETGQRVKNRRAGWE